MAGLMAALTIMLIFTTIVFQDWQDVLRRDLEAEMIFRAHEIARAIHRYRKDHGGQGPPSLEQLGKPGPRGQYYLRRMYEDPLVKDGVWGLLYMGPGGTIIDPTAQEEQQGPLGTSLMAQSLAKAEDRSKGLAQANAPGEQVGLPLAGVKSLSEEEPFRVYNGFADYSQWLFTYLDLETGLAKAPGQPGGPRQGAAPGAGRGFGAAGQAPSPTGAGSRPRGGRP
jgi:hypothetical protein